MMPAGRRAYRPTLWLIDKHGIIRYTHISEDKYDTTERVIGQLLAEPN